MTTKHRYTQQVTVGILASKRTVKVQHEQTLAVPMTYLGRCAAYRQLNPGRPLTARQRRQLKRMSHRANRIRTAKAAR